MNLDDINISRLAPSLENRDNVWHPATAKKTEISYPEMGNELMAEVEDDSFWFSHRNHVILQTLKLFPPQGPLIDIGGGNGFVAKALQNAGLPVIVLEPGLNGIKKAKARGIQHLICSTFEDADFLPGKLPSAGLFDILEHIKNDDELLAKLSTAMAPGKRLYLTAPALNALWSAEDIHAGHFRRYSLQSLGKQLQKYGLTIEFSSYFFSLLPVAIWLFRTVPSRLGFYKKGLTVNPRQHRPPLVLNSLTKWLSRQELTILAQAKPLFCGSSCVIVARKKG